jgi:UDPglucose 6-dehydrogenase
MGCDDSRKASSGNAGKRFNNLKITNIFTYHKNWILMKKYLKLGIVGEGVVGSAVSFAFNTNSVTQLIVDPAKYITTVADLVRSDPGIIFVCVPTPNNNSFKVDISVVRSVLSEIGSVKYTGIVVIKSTMTPDCLIQLQADFNLRLVYNPEFLTEATAMADFVNPCMQVLGGNESDCIEVAQAYTNHSIVEQAPIFKTDFVTASLIKYTINSWLATKVIFMNEINHLQSVVGGDWGQLVEIIKSDPRIGNSHLQVPGPDGHYGFGGKCFPKDTMAFLNYAQTQDVKLSVLTAAITKNQILRKHCNTSIITATTANSLNNSSS